MTDFTIVIPTYNGERFVAEAIGSVLTQTLPPSEIIIVDDCSTDRTLSVVSELVGLSSIPIQVIRLPTNSGGPSKPINIGMEHCRTEFVAVLDQDDCFLPDRLATHRMLFEICEHVDLVFGFVARYGDPIEQTIQSSDLIELLILSAARKSLGKETSYILQPDMAHKLLAWKGNFLMGFPGFSFRRAAWKRNPINERFCIAGDYLFICQLASRGMAFTTASCYRRRVHNDNLSGDFLRSNSEVATIRKELFSKDGRLAKDKDVRTEVKGWFLGCGYWAREAGRLRLSIWFYFSALEIWGWDWRVWISLIKAIPLGAWRRICREKQDRL